MRNGKELTASLTFDFIPDCKMNNDAHGYEIKNGVRSEITMQSEIDLSTKKPGVGISVKYKF